MENNSNFYFIKNEWSDIYNLCENAELYFAKEDYNTVIIKTRQVAEEISKILLKKENILENRSSVKQYDRINILKNKRIFDKSVYLKFNDIRLQGNNAVHKLNKSKINAESTLKNLYLICMWFQKKYGKNKEFKVKPFKIDDTLKFGIEDRIIENEKRMNENEVKIQEQDKKIKELLQKYNEIISCIKDSNKGHMATEDISDEMVIHKQEKIGQIVRSGFEEMIRNNLLDELDILNLKDVIWCKEILGVSYSVLKQIKDMENCNNLRYVNGYVRYWSKIYKIKASNYYICNDWYEKNRSKFINWISKKIDNIEGEILEKQVEKQVAKNQFYKNNECQDEAEKPLRRIPRWAEHSEQCNYKIIRSFLKLKESQSIVTVDMLEKICNDCVNNKDTYVKKFKGNFMSMQTSEGNSHGKIFEVRNNEVKLWKIIEREIMKYKSSFLKD